MNMSHAISGRTFERPATLPATAPEVLPETMVARPRETRRMQHAYGLGVRKAPRERHRSPSAALACWGMLGAALLLGAWLLSACKPAPDDSMMPIPEPDDDALAVPYTGFLMPNHRVRLFADCNDNGVIDVFELQPRSFGLERSDPYRVGSNAVAIAAGDVDDDGDLDLVTANQGDDTVSVLLNTGDGLFRRHPDAPAVGRQPSAIAAVDLNGDGAGDVVTANLLGEDISVLMSAGDGTFAPGAAYGGPELRNVRTIRAADLDAGAHGAADLAAVRYVASDAELIVMWGAGDGTFSEYSVVGLTGDASADTLVTADLDGDADIDLVFGSSVYGLVENRGMRSFVASALTTDVSREPIAAADFDADGRVDLALGPAVLLGTAEPGDYEAAATLDPGVDPDAMVTADMDNDALADIAVAGEGQVAVHLNLGRGHFTPGMLQDIGGRTRALVAADLAGSGLPDLAVANGEDNRVTVLLNTSRIGRDLDGNGVPDACDIADGTSTDCNANGVPDAVELAPVVDFAAYGQGIVRSPFGYDAEVVALDLDNDGDLDLVSANTFDQETLTHHLNSGSGRLASTTTPGTRSATYAVLDDLRANSVAAGHLDGNGRADLAIAVNDDDAAAPHRIEIFRQAAAGFGSERSEWIENDPVVMPARVDRLVALDLTGDGRIELVVTDYYTPGNVHVLNVADDGSIGIATGIAFGGADSPITETPSSVTAADMDQDGRQDLILSVLAAEQVFICRQVGPLDFEPCSGHDAGIAPRRVRAANLTGDGFPDLAVANDYTTGISVLRNTSARMPIGSVGLAAPVTIRLGNYARVNPQDLALVDLDADGDTDIASANWYQNSVSILVNDGDGNFAAPRIIPAGFRPEAVTPADLNADGRADLAVGNGNGRLTVLFNRSRGPSATDADDDGRPDACGPR